MLCRIWSSRFSIKRRKQKYDNKKMEKIIKDSIKPKDGIINIERDEDGISIEEYGDGIYIPNENIKEFIEVFTRISEEKF